MRPYNILGVLAVAVLAIWAADIYYESGPAPTAAATVAAVEQYLGVPPAAPAGASSGLEESPKLAALLSVYQDKPLALGARIQTAGCQVRGPLPDARCTPGAVFEGAGTSTICTPGYSRGVRSVSVKMKKQIYAAYGTAYPQAAGSFEADHLIPLELGGSNDAANLFPESAEPAPGFHEKDLVENYLHDEVCAGAIDLVAAQEQIARDWVAVFDTLSPSTIAALKRHIASYRN